MLTFRAYLAIGAAVVVFGLLFAVGMLSDRLKDARAENTALSVQNRAEKGRADAAEAQVARAEAEGATQAEEAAIVCQGEGAELFNAGRRTGIAIGLSRCPVS